MRISIYFNVIFYYISALAHSIITNLKFDQNGNIAIKARAAIPRADPQAPRVPRDAGRVKAEVLEVEEVDVESIRFG